MRSVFDVYIGARGRPSTELTLPAHPYEILDAYERLSSNQLDHSAPLVEEYNEFEYLEPYIELQTDICGLNALAEKLSELTDDEAIAFHGLVQMEAKKQNGQLSLQRLLDLAYSTDCCHVVDALNDRQLGRFYAENGFVPEVEELSDEAFELLDFEQIGRKMRKSEDGTFVERSADGPGGYVVRYSELKQAPPIPTGPPQKPDYIFKLKLGMIPAIPVPPNKKKTVEISLPAHDAQIEEALEAVGACSLGDTMSTILDGPLPSLSSLILLGNDINTADDLAEQIQDMSVKELGVLKAVMEVIGPVTLDGAMELASQSGEYIFESDIRGVEQAAEAELNAMLGEKDADLIMRHLNLYAYGKALLEQENAAITTYGRLQRRDGQPIQAMEQESGMGGMEGLS